MVKIADIMFYTFYQNKEKYLQKKILGRFFFFLENKLFVKYNDYMKDLEQPKSL